MDECPKHAIRTAVAGDLAAVEEIFRDAYAKYVPRMTKPPAPMVDDYSKRISEGAVWVIENGSEIVGAIVLRSAADHMLLENVAVAPRHIGIGIGKTLIRFAEQEAMGRGHDVLRLYTNLAMHENVAMYLHLGYWETARANHCGYERVFFQKRLR